MNNEERVFLNRSTYDKLMKDSAQLQRLEKCFEDSFDDELKIGVCEVKMNKLAALIKESYVADNPNKYSLNVPIEKVVFNKDK